MKLIVVYTSIIIMLAAAIASAAAQVTFTVSADRSAVPKDDRVTVVARLSTPKTVPSAPQAAASDAFDVLGVSTGQSQSHSVQLINGQLQQKREYIYSYIYTVISKTDGPFTFPPLTVSIDGENYSTRPLHFNGGGSSGGTAGGGGGGGQQQQRGSDVTASLVMPKKTLYPNEQTTLTLKVMQKANTPIQTQRGYAGALEQIEKAFGKEFSLNRLFTNQITQGQERVGNELYNTFTLKYAVFGLTAGEYSIPGVLFEYDEIQRSNRRVNPFFSDFFDMDFFGGTQAVRRSTRTAPFTVTVKPMPQGAPAGFAGSVGKFTVTAAAEPLEVPAGEAVTLRVTLRGNTRASNMGDPVLPEFKNCDVFPPERQAAVDTSADGFSTRKTYRYLIIPKKDGTLTLGPVTYPYFDAASGTYKTASAEPLTVTVTPGAGGQKEQTRYLTQEEIQQVGQDIRYIKTVDRVAHVPPRPYRAPHWYLLFPLPFVFFIFMLIYKSQSKRSDENQIKSIRQKALRIAVSELNKAAKGGTDNEFLGKAATVIEKYISHKFGFPATGRTLEELKDELTARRIDAQTVNGLTALIENINEHRFGGKKFDTQGRGELVGKTTKFLSSMEKTAQKEKGIVFAPPASIILMVTIAALTFTATISANENSWFKTAGEFYAAEEYDSAQTYYTKIVDMGINSAAVFYNLGNCYHRLSKPGLARLYYEKAALLSPADPDIQANIRFIKSIIVDKSEDTVAEPDFLTAVFYNIHTLLPLPAQLATLCALLFALSILGSLMLFKKGLARLWLGYAAALCLLLIITIGASAGYKIYTIESKQHAIVLTASLDAKNQPRGDQTLFTVHEGTKVQIRKMMGEWSLVSLSNGASGWVTALSLGKI